MFHTPSPATPGSSVPASDDQSMLDPRYSLWSFYFLLLYFMLFLTPMVYAITGRSFSGKIIYTHSPIALVRELIERPSDGYPGKLRDAEEGSGTNVMLQKLRSIRSIRVIDMKREWMIVLKKIAKKYFSFKHLCILNINVIIDVNIIICISLFSIFYKFMLKIKSTLARKSHSTLVKSPRDAI